MGAMSGDEEPWAMGQERALHSRRAGTRAVASRRTPIAKPPIRLAADLRCAPLPTHEAINSPSRQSARAAPTLHGISTISFFIKLFEKNSPICTHTLSRLPEH